MIRVFNVVAVFIVNWNQGLGQASLTNFTKTEMELRENLFSNGTYDRLVRPSLTVPVDIAFDLVTIYELSLKDQTLNFNGWWHMRWNDTRIQWEPSSYMNIEALQVYRDLVWTPCIQVSNSAVYVEPFGDGNMPIRASSSGSMKWDLQGVHTTICETDVTYFPFDIQTCEIEVTTSGYGRVEVQMTSEHALQTMFYQESGDWEFLNTSVELEVTYNPFMDSIYEQVLFSIQLKRKPAYYWQNVILPTMLNSFLSIGVFIIPAESGEKLSYALTCFLTFTVQMGAIANHMPTSADTISYLSIYVCLALGTCGLAVVSALINVEVFFRDEKQQVSRWLAKTTMLWMTISGYKSALIHLDKTSPSVSGNVITSLSDGASHKDPTGNGEEDGRAIVKESVSRQRKTLNVNNCDIKRAWEESPFVSWKMVAMMMDSIGLRVFSLLHVVCMITFFTLMING